MTDEELVGRVLEREGSAYTNDPDDDGHATKYGITVPLLQQFRGKGVVVTDADIAALDEVAARNVYHRMLEEDSMIALVPPGDMRELAFDCVVNHGHGKAIVLLQRALGLADDGVLGAVTRKALAAADPKKLFVALCKARILFRASHVVAEPSQVKFLRGHLTRDTAFLDRLAS